MDGWPAELHWTERVLDTSCVCEGGEGKLCALVGPGPVSSRRVSVVVPMLGRGAVSVVAAALGGTVVMFGSGQHTEKNDDS